MARIAAVVATALALATLGMTAPDHSRGLALSSWQYVATYNDPDVCITVGDLGVNNGDWVTYMCRGGVNLWVRYP